MIRRVVLGGLAALCAATGARAGNSYPMVMSLQPVAIQAGTSAEMTVRSRYSMEGAYRVLISGNGVTGQVEPSPTAAPATATAKAASAAKGAVATKTAATAKKLSSTDKSVASSSKLSTSKPSTSTTGNKPAKKSNATAKAAVVQKASTRKKAGAARARPRRPPAEALTL